MNTLNFVPTLLHRLIFEVETVVLIPNLLDSSLMSLIYSIESSSQIEHLPAMEDDPQKRKPDISLAKRVLHWEPKVKMTDGLIKTVEFFKSELSKNDNKWTIEQRSSIRNP